MTEPKKTPKSPDSLVEAGKGAEVALSEDELNKVNGGGAKATNVKTQPTETISLNYTKVSF
jgi:hypothetical protein